MNIERRFVRWCVNKEARIKLEGAEKFCTCVINDLSYMGAKITLPMKLPPDTFLQLKLELCEGNELHVEAWVVWHKPIDDYNTYGLYFTRIKDQDKENIYKYLRGCIPGQIQKHRWEGHIDETEKGGSDMEDRRIFQRFSVGFPVRFIDLALGSEGSALAKDVSAKGVGLLSSNEIKANAPLELWLGILDKQEPLYTRGTVAWSKREPDGRYRAGVNLEKADLIGLSRILRAS